MCVCHSTSSGSRLLLGLVWCLAIARLGVIFKVVLRSTHLRPKIPLHTQRKKKEENIIISRQEQSIAGSRHVPTVLCHHCSQVLIGRRRRDRKRHLFHKSRRRHQLITPDICVLCCWLNWTKNTPGISATHITVPYTHTNTHSHFSLIPNKLSAIPQTTTTTTTTENTVCVCVCFHNRHMLVGWWNGVHSATVSVRLNIAQYCSCSLALRTKPSWFRFWKSLSVDDMEAHHKSHHQFATTQSTHYYMRFPLRHSYHMFCTNLTWLYSIHTKHEHSRQPDWSCTVRSSPRLVWSWGRTTNDDERDDELNELIMMMAWLQYSKQSQAGRRPTHHHH